MEPSSKTLLGTALALIAAADLTVVITPPLGVWVMIAAVPLAIFLAAFERSLSPRCR